MRHRLIVLVLPVVALLATACGDATGPLPWPYDLALHETSETYFASPMEAGCQLTLCLASRDVSADLTGRIRYVGGKPEFTIGDATYVGSGPVTLDAVANDFVLKGTSGCQRASLFVRYTHGKLRGTWNESTACHGPGRSGTLVSR